MHHVNDFYRVEQLHLLKLKAFLYFESSTHSVIVKWPVESCYISSTTPPPYHLPLPLHIIHHSPSISSSTPPHILHHSPSISSTTPPSYHPPFLHIIHHSPSISSKVCVCVCVCFSQEVLVLFVLYFYSGRTHQLAPSQLSLF